MSENTNKEQQYTVHVSPILHGKLEKHLLILRKLIRPEYTKQIWILEAIENKLSREDQSIPSNRQKRIFFRMDLLTKKQLDERVRLIRKFRFSYSKKKWILDAIQEKLDRDADVMKKRLSDSRNVLSNLTVGK